MAAMINEKRRRLCKKFLWNSAKPCVDSIGHLQVGQSCQKTSRRGLPRLHHHVALLALLARGALLAPLALLALLALLANPKVPLLLHDISDSRRVQRAEIPRLQESYELLFQNPKARR